MAPLETARRIVKCRASGDVRPNLDDYASAVAGFSWSLARAALVGLPGGRGLNIAHEAVDRHVAEGRGERVAIRFVRKDGREEPWTCARLAASSNRFANLLTALGVAKGEAVFTLLGRVPSLYVAALGALKAGATYCPLFAAFGPEPLAQRLALGRGRVLVTTRSAYERKVAPMRASLPDLRHVLLTDGEGPEPDGVHGLGGALEAASDRYTIGATAPEDPALVHFTSGTTGKPKGALHVHDAVVGHAQTARYALDLRPHDVYWCTADPGWVTGTSYGIVAPLVIGCTLLVDEAEFDPERWYAFLRDRGVNVWYTAPTAVRMLMRTPPGAARRSDFAGLRFIASVGEPLHAEAVAWGEEAFGRPIHDNWWQTETGGIMIANFAATDIKPGSMGRPLPGVEAAVLRHEPDGALRPAPAGEEGELALRPGWPSMFRGYLGEEERYRRCFAQGWYLSGDLARVDDEGYFWFVGRADDVIKSAGHRIGPFEVESALMAHPLVAEAAVIGKPDPVVHEVVKAFVSLRPGVVGDEGVRRDVLAFARRRLGTVVAPKEVEFLDVLPRTRSGKILRRMLRARELGLPLGDTSTLEAGA